MSSGRQLSVQIKENLQLLVLRISVAVLVVAVAMVVVPDAAAVTAVLLTAAVAALVCHRAPGHNARRSRLSLALRLLQRVELADLLLLEALQLPALLLERSDGLVPLAVGGVACRDRALLLLTRLREQGAEGLDLKFKFLAGLLV